jgi:hypothetical protein
MQGVGFAGGPEEAQRRVFPGAKVRAEQAPMTTRLAAHGEVGAKAATGPWPEGLGWEETQCCQIPTFDHSMGSAPSWSIKMLETTGREGQGGECDSGHPMKQPTQPRFSRPAWRSES